jgi:hypothetical protein
MKNLTDFTNGLLENDQEKKLTSDDYVKINKALAAHFADCGKRGKIEDGLKALENLKNDGRIDFNMISLNDMADSVIKLNSLPLFNQIKKTIPEFFKIINDRMGDDSADDAALLGDVGFK